MFSSYFHDTYPDSSKPYARPFDLVMGRAEPDPLQRDVAALRRALHQFGFSAIGGDLRQICLDVDAVPFLWDACGAPVLEKLDRLKDTAAAESYRLSLHGDRPGCALTTLLAYASHLCRGGHPADGDQAALGAAFKDLWRADDYIDPRLSAGEMLFRDTARVEDGSVWLETARQQVPLAQASLSVLRQTSFANKLAWMFMSSRLLQHIDAPEDVIVGLTNQAMHAVLHGQDQAALTILARAKGAPLHVVAAHMCDRWPHVSPFVDLFMDRAIRVRQAKGLIASLPSMARDAMRLRNGAWVQSLAQAVDQKGPVGLDGFRASNEGRVLAAT